LSEFDAVYRGYLSRECVTQVVSDIGVIYAMTADQMIEVGFLWLPFVNDRA